MARRVPLGRIILTDYFRALDNANGPIVMRVGDYLYSPTRAFRLGLQWDGNLVLYAIDDFDPTIVEYSYVRVLFEDMLESVDYSRAIWATGTNGREAHSWSMQSDGNLVVYEGANADGPAVWASGTPGNPFASLVCQDDGNLVIYEPRGGAVWSSNTYAGKR